MTTNATHASTAASWHLARARAITKEDSALVKGLHNQRVSSLLAIGGLLAAQLGLAAWCATLGPWAILALSATVGAFFAWGLQNFLHDVTHKSVALTRHRWVQALLQRLCAITFPDLGLYLYYRWHHHAHHRRLAADGLRELEFGRGGDQDAYAVSSLYQVKEHADSEPQPSVSGVVGWGPPKVLVGLVPLWDYLVSNGMLVFFAAQGLVGSLVRWPAGLTADRVRARRSALLHLLLVVAFQAATWRWLGPGAVLYFWLSYLFVKGFLFHPYLLFWVTIHKTTHHADQCQPTTSTYSGLADVLFWGLNNHVEHHDFPGIPSPDLPKLRARFGDHYDSLFSFASISGAYREFFARDTAWVYGCQDD